MTRTRVVVFAVLTAVLATAVVLVVRHASTTPQERYCDEVVARRAELSDVLSTDAGDRLLQALPIFTDLQQRAPRDITDEWQVVVSALQGLRGALKNAGVDPTTYDRDDPPAGLADADRDRIDAAAQRVGAQATATALTGLDQHARDVCGTPLTQ